MAAIQTGDLLFIRPTSAEGRLVTFFDKGPFSHVCVAVSDTHIIEAALGEGVKTMSLPYKSFELVRLNLTDAQKAQIVAKAKTEDGKQYDLLQCLGYVVRLHIGSPNRLICSELAYELLKAAGIDTGSRYIEPNELYQKLLTLAPILVKEASA